MRLPACLEGAADLHVHSSPDVDPRRYDDFELAQEAARAGMSALLIKSHQGSTVERALLASKIAGGFKVFGGLVLNQPVGGLNPDAVDIALRLGAKEIWMPTRSAANHRRRHGQTGGITLLDPDGRLAPAADEIVRRMAGEDCILATGHVSPEEGLALIDRALALGVRKVMVTHPEWYGTVYPADVQRALASRGVFFERCFVSTTHRCGFTPFEVIENAIAAAGVATTVLATDLGQPDTPAPVEGLKLYAERLLASGFSPDDLRRMMCENPRRLLSLDAAGAPLRED